MRCLVLALALFGSSNVLTAQQSTHDPDRVQAQRSELEELMRKFNAAAQSQAYSPVLRERARGEAERIRARLSEGDFRVGDRVVVAVEGDEQLTDTFVVAAGQTVVMPIVGTVLVRGVLRSELESHLTGQIAAYVRDPVVRAQSLLRIAIFGEVARPGFHLVPPEMPITEALMSVGGPTQNADLAEVRIRRGDANVARGERMQRALQAGLTLDQLGLRAGDEIIVPKRSPFAAGEIGRSVVVAVGVLGSLFYSLSLIR
jgi:protein involved in polysaccharide export with SLBB domain